MKRLLCRAAMLMAVAHVLHADIVGFEDPSTLSQVMSGKILIEDKPSSKNVLLLVSKAYFNKVSAEAFAELATNHSKYPDMFSEISAARTKSVSADKTTFDYWMDLEVKIGPFTKHVYPEGRQMVTLAGDAIGKPD